MPDERYAVAAAPAAETTSLGGARPGVGPYAPPARRGSDLAGSLLLQAQKQERRLLAVIVLRQAVEAAKAAGVGPRESAVVRDAESAAAYAQRQLELATGDVALALREAIRQVVDEVLHESQRRAQARA